MASSSSPSTSSSTSSSSSSSPCAACKLLRRKCTSGCVFAPYFPPDQPAKFANVHKVFGASNVAKVLNDLPPTHREDAVNSLAYEADARIRDPVYGCVGLISILQQRLRAMEHELSAARRELATLYAASGAGGAPSDNVNTQLPMQNADPGQQQHAALASGSPGGLFGVFGACQTQWHNVPAQLPHHSAGGGGGPSASIADPTMGTAFAGLMLPQPQPLFQLHPQGHQNFLQIMSSAERELRFLREAYRPGAQQMQQHQHPLHFRPGNAYGLVGHTNPAAVPVDQQIASPQPHQHSPQELAVAPHPGFSSLQPFQQAPEAGQQLRRAGSLEHRQALLRQQMYYVKGEERSEPDDGGRSNSGGGGVLGP